MLYPFQMVIYFLEFTRGPFFCRGELISDPLLAQRKVHDLKIFRDFLFHESIAARMGSSLPGPSLLKRSTT